MEGQVPSEWFGRAVSLKEGKDRQLMLEMVWELCEMGFRHELLEVDRFLVPSMGRDPDTGKFQRWLMVNNVFPPSRPFHLKQLPTAIDGLAASDLVSRARYLDALRLLLSRWPSVPPSIKSSQSLLNVASVPLLEKVERDMAKFYCQTFYEVSGRAAIIPRRFPISL